MVDDAMNPFLNPVFLCRVLKSYLADPDRLQKMRKEDVKILQDRALKRMVKYAYSVPLYREKYKNAGVHPNDIRGVDDIKKLPFITKEDLRNNFPDNIISPTFNKRSAIISSTSGTTGRSLSIYFDLYTVIKGMLGFVRAMKEYGVNWRKTKMTLLLDLSENSFENEYFVNSIFSTIKPIIDLKNMQIFSLFDSPLKVIKEVDNFQPEFIAGYPFMIIQLALLKSKGYGKKIKPKCIMTSGAYFDNHSRKQVEEIFDTSIFDFYAATESGPIAFECRNRTYHIHSDLVYPEVIENGEYTSYGKPGSLVITKLYGAGTPIIRYTGIDDVVTPLDNDCSCGLAGGVLKKIHGRKTDSILLPNGKMAFVSLFENVIGETLYKMKTNKIKRIQIVQHKLDRLEIKILLDEELKRVAPSTDKMFSAIKSSLHGILGSDIKIIINEVNRFDSKDPYIVSKIDRSKFVEKMYLV